MLERNPDLNVLTVDESMKVLTNALDKHQQVFYTRYGDGEYNVMNGLDGQHYKSTPELAKELIDSLKVEDEKFLLGLGCNFEVEKGMYPGIFYPTPPDKVFSQFMVDLNKEVAPSRKFLNAVGISYYSVYHQQKFIDFLDKYIRPKKKIYIGPIDKEIAEKCLGPIEHFYRLPRKDAYLTLDDWYEDFKEKAKDVELVLPFAGAASGPLHLRMWNDGLKVHSLDLGSFIDGIFYPKNRKWVRLKGHVMKKLLLPEHQDKSLSYKMKYYWGEFKFETRLMRKKLFGTLYINK